MDGDHGLSPSSSTIAVAAGDLDGLPGDSADRIIYASALIGGLPLITKDRRLLRYAAARDGRVAVVW